MKTSPEILNSKQSDETGESSQSSDTSSKWSILEKLAGKYDAQERGRVEEARKKIETTWSDPLTTFAGERIDASPSIARKIGRLALDHLGIHFSKLEKRRDGEAMSVALYEYEERRQREQEDYELTIMRQREAQERARQEQEKWEKKDLEMDLVRGMDKHRFYKHERFKSQRAQEILERDFNSRLLTVDMLEDEILRENPEVEKAQEEYDGKIIPIYTLKGIPFSMISHDVEYRKANLGTSSIIGTETFQELVKDPSIWSKKEDEAKQEEGFGSRGSKAKGNVISASYIDSESNLGQRVGSSDLSGNYDLCYGFSHIKGGELLAVSQRDGGTPNIVSKNTETFIDKRHVSFIDSVEGSSGRAGYNEVLLRRYSKEGKPHLPDYIITENGVITDDMLRHAAFFGIPIINIERKVYEARAKSIAIEALDAIDENSSYEEVSSTIDKIKRTHRYNGSVSPVEIIGDGRDIKNFEYERRSLKGEMSEKFLHLEELEMRKRIDFIAQELQDAIRQCKQATAKGEEYEFSSDKIKLFNCEFLDNQNGVRYSSSGKVRFTAYQNPVNSNEINFDFRFKDSTRTINTKIRNGESRTPNDEFDKILIEKSDNSHYDKIQPLVMEYFAALEENRKIVNQ